MNKKRKTIIRDAALGFISFMACILLVSLSGIFIIEKTLFSPNFLNKAAEKTEYYDNLTDQISLQIQDYGLGSGIPTTVLTDLISPQQVQKDFVAYTHQAFFGTDFAIEEKNFATQIKTPIYAYAEEKKQELTPETEAGIERFTTRSFEAYSDFIKLPFLPAFGQKIQLFSSKLTLFKVIIGSSLALMLILITYLLHWWRHRFLRYLSFIFSGSGFMLIGAPALVLLSGKIKLISITSKPLYLLLTTYLTRFFMSFILVGVALLGISLITALTSQVMRKHA